MGLDAEEIEFERELAQKNHNELLDVLRKIKIPEPKDNSDIVRAFESNIKILADKIANIHPPKIVTEKTVINQTEVVNSLKEMIKEIKSLKESLSKKETPKQMEFNVVRNNFGFIQSVIVKQVN